MSHKYFFIVNPHSASRRTGRIWPHVKEEFEKKLGRIDFAMTKGNIHATYLAGEALYKGYDRIVTVGGDGTLNETVNGFYDANGLINNNVVLGYFPSGTGEDLARTFKIENAGIAEHVDRIVNGVVKKIDIGNVQFLKADGSMHSRKFINEISAGFTANVASTVNTFPKFMTGKIAFLLGIAGSLAMLKNREITVKAGGKEIFSGKALAACVTNGKFFGGSMKIAPEAEVNDGLFEIIIIKNMGRIELIRKIGTIYEGSHIKDPKVMTARAREIQITSRHKVGIEMDGEPVGFVGAKINVHEREVGFIV